MLCDNLEDWDGLGGGKEVQEGWEVGRRFKRKFSLGQSLSRV